MIEFLMIFAGLMVFGYFAGVGMAQEIFKDNMIEELKSRGIMKKYSQVLAFVSLASAILISV